ncbi:MAG: T9SS type A sorting domain-containing protein, partial [candidate division WOR-3 bacterium]|nr:T9SS type A sorting domain-containing protein [candidate division WOR-3 bacterium]
TYAIQYRWKDITKASYYIKYANGTVTSEQIMSIQNIPSNSPFFVANSDNISQTTSRDTVFVQVQTDEYFLSGWYKTSGQVTTSIDEEFIPDKFKLYDLYPNPFNNSTTLEFDLPESQEITIEICDLLGRRILQIFKNEFFYPGKHRFNLNLTELTSGVYFLIFKSQKINEIKKLVLLK